MQGKILNRSSTPSVSRRYALAIEAERSFIRAMKNSSDLEGNEKVGRTGREVEAAGEVGSEMARMYGCVARR